MRKSRLIKDSIEVNKFIKLTEDDITLSFITETFGEFDEKSKYNPYDLIVIPANSYGPEGNKNLEPFVTGLGMFIFNKYFIEKDLFNVFQYVSDVIDDDVFGKMNKKISYALLEDDITLEQFKRYLMKTQKTMPYVSILSPSCSDKMEGCTKVMSKKKKELQQKYKDQLQGLGNEVVSEKIESELKAYAREYLKDDPSMDLYNSGARGSFNNNFKNMYLMKGAVKDPNPNKGYDINFSNFMDGISKEEYPSFAKALVAGPYARAKKTEVGGYWEKQFVLAFQHVVLDKPGSDCHVDKYLEITLTKDNIADYMYSYIKDGDKLVELTSKNMDKYLNKKVKMRFSLFCKSKTGYCNKCAGNLFYRLGIRNLGVATAMFPSKLKNLSMKSFHDSTVKTIEMDPMKAFGLAG